MLVFSYVVVMKNHIAMLDELEARIAIAGLAGTEPELQRLADILVRSDVAPAITGIIADPEAPEVARLRAIGRASRALRAVPVSPMELVPTA